MQLKRLNDKTSLTKKYLGINSVIKRKTMWNKTGIYIATPTSNTLKSIYRAQNYKTQVNNEHLKIGITKDSFQLRSKCYYDNFDNEVDFIPLVAIDRNKLKEIENKVLNRIKDEFTRVGRAREWFDTNNKARIISILISTLNHENVEYEFLKSDS